MKEICESISNIVPVEWDRYTEGKITNVYGWIKRSDGQRDFLLIQLMDGKFGFVTSSAKYSKVLHEYLFGDLVEHNDCIKYTK